MELNYSSKIRIYVIVILFLIGAPITIGGPITPIIDMTAYHWLDSSETQYESTNTAASVDGDSQVFLSTQISETNGGSFNNFDADLEYCQCTSTSDCSNCDATSATGWVKVDGTLSSGSGWESWNSAYADGATISGGGSFIGDSADTYEEGDGTSLDGTRYSFSGSDSIELRWILELPTVVSDTRYLLKNTENGAEIDAYTNVADITVLAARDTSSPNVSIQSPFNNTWTNSRDINFTFIPLTNDDFLYCDLYHNESNWGFKQRNSSPIYNSTLNGINDTFDSDGVFIWNVECSDKDGNFNTSIGNFTIKIDTIKPNVTELIYPTNNSVVGASMVDHNFTANDSMSIYNCTLWANFSGTWKANYSELNMANNQEKNISVSLNEGVYKWNINCFDEAGNSQFFSSNYTYTLDLSAPIIKLESPENNSEWDSSAVVDFSFNVSDASDIKNCSLIINSRLNQSNETKILKDTTGQTISEQLEFKAYNWSINCTDIQGYTGSSEEFSIIVNQDVGAPTIKIVSPTNNSFTKENPVILQATTNENAKCKYNNSNATFNYTTDGTFFSTTGATSHSASISGLEEGNYVYYIKCNDSYNNINNYSNQAYTYFTVDRSIGNVTLIYPTNNSNFSPTNINFRWSAIDPYIDENLTCNITIDSIVNVSDIASGNNTITNISIYIGNGTYYWNITCWDNASNSNTSETRYLVIDGDGPEFGPGTIIANPSVASAGSDVTISATITDNFNNVGNVYVNVTNPSDTEYYYSMSYIGSDKWSYSFSDTSTAGVYSFFIQAYDDAAPIPNYRISSSSSFEIKGVSSSVGIQTVNKTYKQAKIIDLTNSHNYSFSYKGSNVTINTLIPNEEDYKCSDAFGYACSGTADDTFDSCWPGGADSAYDIHQVYVNSTSLIYTDNVRISCEIDCGSPGDNIYIYYRNSSTATWKELLATTCSADGNITYDLNVDDVSGEHQARCIYDRDGNTDDCSESGGGGANSNRYDNDDINFTVLLVDNDGITSPKNYTDIGDSNYTKITDIDITVEISDYNDSASTYSDNNQPNLKIYMYDGSGFSYSFVCNASALKDYPANCTKKVVEPSIVNAWQDRNKRKMQIRGIDIDYYEGISDFLNWTNVYTEFSTPSKLENYGEINMSSRLLLKVEFYNKTTNTWETISTVYNSTINITINQSIDISSIWNKNNYTSDTRDLGEYRASIALTDSSGTVLQNADGTYINDTYNFNISYLKIKVDNPQNSTTVDGTQYWVNLTADETYYKSAGWCAYSLDNTANITMVNDSLVHFFNKSYNTSEGLHNLTLWCNDTEGDYSFENTQFYSVDQTAPNISLIYPTNGQDGLPTTITFRYNVTDIVTNIINCSIYIDNRKEATNSTIIEDHMINFTISNLDTIRHDWKILCYDNSSQQNLGISDTWEFLVGTDTDPPYIFLGDPQNNTLTTNNDVTFYFGVYDEKSNIKNCSLILNNQINQSKGTAEIIESFNNDDNWFVANDMSLGQYNWSINCTDDSSNENRKASEFRNITITEDTDFPIIILDYPENDTILTSNLFYFRYNVTDTSSGIINCSLYINGTINNTVNNPSEGVINSISVSNPFNEGLYNWSIECTDDSFQLNKNISNERYFTIIIMADLKVSVGTDKDRYEQGTQNNHTISIATNVSDVYDNPINATVTSDVIKGNTTLRWWNSSWKRRRPILLSEHKGYDRINVTVWVNLTGIGGNIGTCSNEIRVIRNNSLEFIEVNSKVTGGDNNSYCEFIFNANISANANRENYYYVYYDNPTATSKTYGGSFNQSTYQTGDIGAFLGTYADTYGVFSNTFLNDDNYWAFGSTSGTDINAYAEIKFNLTNLNISYNWLKKIFFNITYCHSGESSTPDCNGDTPIEGSADGNQKVEAYNFNSETWMEIGNLNPNNNEYEVNSSYTIISNASDYINSSQNVVIIRYEFDWNATGFNPDMWLVIDYAIIAVEYDAQVYTSEIEDENELINRSINDSGTSGGFGFNLSTNGLSKGWYSIVSLAEASGYNDALNYSVFEITADRTAPIIQLMWPTDDYVSTINNITFRYNVTDELSGVVNCSLIINGTINLTNASITENKIQNFSIIRMPNGNYVWSINCTDDYNNTGTYTPAWDLAIEFDQTAPDINIVGPVNGYNDTNGNLTLYYNVSDDYSNIANCSLIINETINQTVYDVQQDIKINFTVNSTAEGFYSWYINCSDDSLATNKGSSEKRNITVILDYAPPKIIIKEPGEIAQSTTGNVSFIFNVSDEISGIENCSLIINGSINQTIFSIDENVLQNFTVYNLSIGIYSWNITCTDNSENYNTNTTSPIRNLTVATDTEGPDVYLEFPPINAQLIETDVIFRYNVTDLASDIANCSLIINGTLNQTNHTIYEYKSNNFSVRDFNYGVYNWSINCTDDATNPNTDSSEWRILTIGIDETPPEITLEWPQNNNYNDTDGNVTFFFKVYDLASDIANCTVILDGVFNKTNESKIVESTSGQNISIGGINNGSHTWSVNCTDIFGNQGNSTSWNFNVILDYAPPQINLITPENNSIDTDGNVMFYFNASDEISALSNCSLIINGEANISNVTIEDKRQNFSLTGLSNGQYNWSINCTDSSDNRNVNSSETRNLTVIIDTGAPRINLINPVNNTLDSDGYRIFYYNVTDDISEISSCSLLFNGAVVQVNGSVEKDTPQNFTISDITNGQYNWSVSCTDASDYLNINNSAYRNITVLIDNDAPVVKLIAPENYTQDVDNNITFLFNVSDLYPISECTLILNGSLNRTNNEIIRNSTLNITYNYMPNGTFEWSINCTDSTEESYVGESEKRILYIGPDLDAPVINLEYPPNYIVDPDGILMFKFNVSDFASDIINCSLIINDTINQTNITISEEVSQNFSVSGFNNGFYKWQVNCTDNSTAKNSGGSEKRYFEIGIDEVAPVVNLTSPANNTRLTSQRVVFSFIVDDLSSDIANCSLIINGKTNQTNNTLLTEGVSQNFTIANAPEGNYNWSVNCTDNSVHPNTGTGRVFNLTIKLKETMNVNITTNQTSYEKGESVLIKTNVTDNESNPLRTSVIVDIIKGNSTASWWNTSWNYRIPVVINSTNYTRIDKLIELNVNFTDVFKNQIGDSGIRLDNKSIRVIEWRQNKSEEVISQFEEEAYYDSLSNAIGKVIWLMNGTTETNKIRYYYVYFDTTDNLKAAASYEEPTYTLVGSTQDVNYNGEEANFDRITISYGDDLITFQLDMGDKIDNFDYVDRAGAGGITNITINKVRITNPNSIIAPLAVRLNDYLQPNGTSSIDTGPVVTKINIPANISTITGSDAEVNYTVWFSGNEIFVRADLYVEFTEDELDPSVMFQNEWFAYLMNNKSNWENYIYKGESETQNRTHYYNRLPLNGFGESYASSWYSEHDGIGSINLVSEFFKKNGVDNKRVIIFDDGYADLPESDSIGFSYDEIDIYAPAAYSMKVFMVFSNETSSKRAKEIEKDINSPINITKGLAERWINRSSGKTDENGVFYNNWSTVNISAGWYTATALTNITYFYNGFDYYIFRITRDQIPPTVTLGDPTGWINYNNVTFNYYVSENNLVVKNCTLILNNIANITNSTPANEEWNTINLNNIPEAVYNWSVNCTDEESNVGNSSTQKIYVDISPPEINLTFPNDSITLNYTIVDFNFTATDNLADNISCYLNLNDKKNVSLNTTDSTLTNITLNLSQGTYEWNITCEDLAGNTNSSKTRNLIVDIESPQITLINPIDPDNWFRTRNITFVYVPTDASNITNCSVIIDGEVALTNNSINRSTNNNITIYYIAEGKHEWNVNCTDAAGRIGMSSTETFYVDLTNPYINLTWPSEGYNSNSSNIQFNFTATDNLDNVLECNISIDNVVNNTQIIYASNYTNISYNISGFVDGLFYWNVTCKDNAGNLNASNYKTFWVNEPPSVILGNPGNNTRTNIINQSFYTTPEDNSGQIANCTLIFNSQKNGTNYSINEGIEYSINVSNIAQGEYNWTVNCTDPSGNTDINDSYKIIYVDILPPQITLIRPYSLQALATDDVLFNFSATDQFGLEIEIECNITLDGVVNVSEINILSGEYNATIIPNLSLGRHNWSVTCKDDLNNTNTTGNVTFIVQAPDVRINNSDIVFNNTDPKENDTILINATVYNIGGVPAENFNVTFYELREEEKVSIGNSTVTKVDSQSNETVSITWNISLGLHKIYAIADYKGDELRTDNNYAYNNISTLVGVIFSPINNTWTRNSTNIINFTIRDYDNNSLNYTFYLDGMFNKTANIIDNQSIQVEFNLSEGVHYITLEAFGPRIDVIGKENNLSRKHNTSIVYITVDKTNSTVLFETANNTWFNDNTPEIAFNITDNLDNLINYTLYIDNIANYSNSANNGTSTKLNLTVLNDGRYSLLIETIDDAGNKKNSSFIILYVDTTAPAPKILTTNNSNFTDDTPEIEFNISDNLATTLNFTFYINDISSTEGTAINGVNRTANLTTQSDGYKIIILEAKDQAGNKANSTFINITIDTTPPSITIENPREYEALGYVIQILTTVTDSFTGVDSVMYTIRNSSNYYFKNGTLNSTTSFDDYWNSSIDIGEDIDYMDINLTVLANDSLGNRINISRMFIIDNKKPSINFIVPYGHDFNSNFRLNITLQNRNLTLSIINITNSTGKLKFNRSNDSIFSPRYDWDRLVNISNTTIFPEGIYNITVYALDEIGNNRTSTNFFRIDRTAPTTILNEPQDLYNTTSTRLEFNFTTTDLFNEYIICNLSIDNVIRAENRNATNNTKTNVTVSSITEGYHLWNVTCVDKAGNANTSKTRNFTIDLTAPSVKLGTPMNNSFNSSVDMVFYYTPNDNLVEIENCSLIINGKINQTNNTITKGVQNSFIVQNLAEGEYLWTVNCTDNVLNTGTNESIRTLYIDTTAPNTSLITNNGTWFNDATPEIFFNITDNLDSYINYTIYVDGNSDIVSYTLNATRTSNNLSSLENGTHLIVIESYDNAYNRINTTNMTIIIDTAAPNITIFNPHNNSNITFDDLEFSFNVTDNLDEWLICNLTINDIVNTSGFNAQNGENTSISVNDFNTGYYNWTVICQDNASNVFSSSVYYFNYTPPDLEISQIDITFNQSEFEEGKNFTIFANISNIGRSKAENFVVNFYDGNPSDGASQLNGDFRLNLSAGENKTINLSWSFDIGTTNIFVEVDTDNVIIETNEDNNKANKSINISAYNIIFGNITGSLIIGSFSNQTIFSWQISNATSGNVFVVDSDSRVTWTNLSAIGINTSYGNESDDFTEIDKAMNMQNLSDSINKTYLSDNKPKNLRDFIVFANIVNSTPYVNSTNTSDFITGIMWDMSDNNPGEYNGSQDIVFISRVNRMKRGKYGIYDLEIKVPARLREYIQPNKENSVTLYVELR